MPKLRLSLLFPHLALGGGETATMDLAEALAQRVEIRLGAVHVGEGRPADELSDELRSRLGHVEVLEHRWQLRPWLGEADALLWYGVNAAVPTALRQLEESAGRRPASVRVVHTERVEDGHAFHRRHARQIDATVCVSPAIARAVPGGVFVANACSRAYLQGARRRLFPPGRATLGCLGRLVPQKNFRWLVANVDRLECNLALQVLDTELETADDLRRLAAERDVADRVRFLPATRDVGTLLRSVDALVVASRHEGFPRVVMEAALVGTPVISTRVGALPELFPVEIRFIDSVDGRPDAESLRRAVSRLQPGRRHELRHRAGRLHHHAEALRHRVEALCNPKHVADEYLREIQEARASRAGERTSCRSTAS